MSNSNQPRFLLNNCCFCCTVETGSKIIGYIGAISAAIYIILGVTAVILLNIGQTTTVTVSGDVNNTAPLSSGNLAGALVLTIFTILVYITILIINVVLLIGLNKKRPNYVKIYLIVGIVSLVLAFILDIIAVILTLSFASILSLIYLLLPIYFLLVIRSAYFNMLEADAAKPNIIYAPTPTVASPAPNDNIA